MKLFDALSPAPRCLRMYLIEKGIMLDSVQVDVFAGENRQAPYLQHNPAGQTPALLLDDGTCIAESVAIMEYVEELHPEPPLFGSTPRERALTRQGYTVVTAADGDEGEVVAVVVGAEQGGRVDEAGAGAAARQRAAQAVNRCSNSSPLSVQKSRSLNKAFLAFSGELGTLASKSGSTISMAFLLTGP